MRLVNLQGAESVQHPEHGAAVVGSDGVFDVDDALGQALLAQRASWSTEADYVSEAARRRMAPLLDPKKAAEVLDFVHGRTAEQDALIATLEARVAELEAGQAATEQPEPPAKPTSKSSK